MPDENGLEFIRRLRSSAQSPSSNVPAIALTAYVRDEEIAAALAAGFQAHVGKPISGSALIESIHQITESFPALPV